MKKVLLSLMLIACSALVSAVSLAQNSFSYQSVIRNNGEVVSNQDVALLISILSGSDVCYQEVQKVKTNAYGNISISVGEGEPKTGSFAAIPWETMQIMMQIEVSTDGTENYVNLGQMQIQPVPYTMYAARTTTVIQPKEASEDPIFEVRDSEGNLMFAVYETGVKVFVDQEGSKAAKSKFAVAGRSVSKDDEDLLTIDAAGTTVYVDDNEDDNTKAAKSKFAVAGRSAKGDNNIITIDGSGSTLYVDDDQNGKAAKSKFAVAGRTAKGDNLLTVDNAGATVYVDDNASTKAAKSKFAVAGRSAKGDKNKISIDGSGSTIYVDNDDNKNADKKTKAAKSRFAVAGRSAKKSENLFTIDGDGSTVYVDFNTSDKAAKSRFAVAGRSAKGAEDALTIDGDQATFYIDADDNDTDKAAKSRFAVAGRSAKDVQTAFVVDGSGTLVYIDEWDDSKAAKSTFAVAGRSVGKGGNNYFTISQDSTRIYINDEPVVDTATGAVTTPTLASAFAIVGMTKKTDMLVVNRDSTIVKMNTYVEEQVQTASGEVEKLPDDTKADKVYTTGKFFLYFDDAYDEVNYTYYRNGADEYLYLREHFNDEHYEHRNYWLVDGKIYRDTAYLKSWNGLVPIYTYRNNLNNYFYDCNWNEYWDTEPFVAEGGSNGGLLTLLESKIRQDGYKVKADEGINRYYKMVDNEEWPAAETERNTVTALHDIDIFNNQNYLTTFKQLLEPSVAIMGKDLSLNDVDSIKWDETGNYTLLDSCVTEENILAEENGEDGFYIYYDSQGNYVNDYVYAADEHEIFYYKDEHRKHTLADIDYMFDALKRGFVVMVSPTEGGSVTGLDGGSGTYTYGSTVTLTAVPQEGFIFLGWNDGSSENPRTFAVMGHTTVWANFQSLSDYELVDLGLTTKWAKSNLGASSATSAGGYYSWGETITKSAYTESTYTINSSSDFRDAANTILGNNYRMPAIEDWIALKDSCNWEYDPDKGCFKVSNKDNSNNYIYIPATGYFDDYDGYQDFVPDDSYSNCYYLSRSEDSYYYFKTFLICSDPSESRITEKYKYYGFQIRPVANTYNVTLVADGNGTVSGGGTFNAGATTTITATAGDGYTFVRWSDGNSDNPRLLAVTEHTNLEAVFADILYVSQADPSLETHDGSAEYPYSSIAEAVSTMESGKNYEIRVVGTIEGPQVISCPAKVLALTGYGDNAKLDGKGSAANTVTTLSIAANTVIIKNLTITGGYASGSGSASGINVSGNVTIDQGVAVTGNTAANGASIVFVDGGSELHIQSGRIADNTAENAHKGVYLNGWGQYARATLCLSGNPVVEDIYPSRIDNWPDYHHVTLEGNLSGDASINITPYDYYVGLDLVISYVSMADNRKYFTVTPNDDGKDWTITDEGSLSYNCILTFTVNGKVVETRKVLYDEKTEAPVSPQNPNPNEYVFAGWYYENYDEEENLFVEFDFENETVRQKTMDLQPKWLKPSKQLVVNAAYTENDAEGTQAKPFNRIQNALAAIELFDRPEWDYTIVIDGELTGTQEIGPSVVAQKLTLKGKNELLNGVPQDSLKGSGSGSVLTINNTTTPIVIENLKITGGYSVQGGGICNNGGTLTLESGTLITRNNSDDYNNYEGGAGLFTNGGTVTINSGAVISSNTARNRGGGLALMNGARVTLNGGEIKNNETYRYGGAVMFCEAQYDNQRSTFIMESGTISGNEVTATSGTDGFGGCVYITQGEFILKGGDIINNTAGNTGGAIHNDDTFTMQGGTLSGNKAINGNGGAISNYNTINITGGTISGNSVTSTSGKGKAIYQCNKENGTFNMGGSAKIEGDNDVYLDENQKITILAPLTADTVAVVTPFKYELDAPIIDTIKDVSTTTPEKECGRFFVTPQSGGTYTEWWVKARGVLTPHERRINVANDADHPYVITSDPNFTMEINGETVTTVKSQQVFITADVFDVTEDRAYYITFRNFEHNAPVSGWGCIGFHNFNEGTTFTYHITLEGENISHGNNSSAMGNSGCDGAIKFVFDAITSGSFTFYDIMHSYTSFGKGVGDVSFELAKGCTFSGTIAGVDNEFTDIKTFFEAASQSTEECSFTITRN